MAGQPKVTIIVPTRNRCDTLHHALRTCVIQDYDPLQILVSDNCSDDATRDVVVAASDPRVRYVKTDRRVAMSQNWEFALGHVDDGYVLVLGDDDALLPHAISDIARILQASGCEGIAWREARYNWPSVGGGNRPNELRLSIRTGWRVERAKDTLNKVATHQLDYRLLPSLYWGAFDRAAMKRATSSDGRFFHSPNPDVYSAIATTMVIDRYVFSERPYRINGLSRHSTGISFSSVEKAQASPREVYLAENKGGIPFHPKFAFVPSSPVYTAEAYQQAREHVPGGASYPETPIEIVIEQMMKTAATDRPDVYPLVVEGVRDIARRAGTADVADPIIARHPYRGEPTPGNHPLGISLKQMSIKVDCSDFAVKNVYDAALLCHTIVRLFEADYLTPKGIAQRMWSGVRNRLVGAIRS
jgi:glycosyltransferase involved in cell wall biosynthesis